MTTSKGSDETEIALNITMMSRVGKSTTTQHILLNKYDPTSKAHGSPKKSGKGAGSKAE